MPSFKRLSAHPRYEGATLPMLRSQSICVGNNNNIDYAFNNTTAAAAATTTATTNNTSVMEPIYPEQLLAS